MKFKKWLILTQYYPPEVGAPQIRLSKLAEELRRNGCDVEVVTAMPNYPEGAVFPGYRRKFICTEKIRGIKVTRVWLYPSAGEIVVKRAINYLTFTFFVLPVLLFKSRPDVLFVEAQPLSLGFVAVLLKVLRGIPYIFNIPDLQVEAARQMGFIKHKITLRIMEVLERWFCRQSFKVSTVTEGFIRHFTEKGIPREQMTFLPNGVDTDFLCPMPPFEAFLEKWKLRGKKVFLYAGTLTYYQDLLSILSAAERLKSVPDIVFLIAGKGPMKAELERLKEEKKLDNVLMTHLPFEEMPKLYSISYASLVLFKNLPFTDISRPSKIFPSLSCGVPVIFAGRGETAKILEEEKCGLVLEPENPEKLAETIKLFARQDQKRTEMGRFGRCFVEKRYQWPTLIKDWLNQL